MTATHKDQITREAIAAFLARIQGASVEWMGDMPTACERYDAEASQRAHELTADQVLEALDRGEFMGDTPDDEIEMAASVACEPADLPENACVAFVVGPANEDDRNQLIASLYAEMGDTPEDIREAAAQGWPNMAPADLDDAEAAADGDVAALCRLRTSLGLPLLT